ncbi:MAG: hypothetical protein ABI478_12050 [Propionivibrio sp.]
MWRLLGARPTIAGAPSGSLLKTEITLFARVEHWRLRLNDEEPVPALLLHPLQLAPRGVVLYCHAHGHQFACGKDEVLNGRPSLQAPAYGEVLPAMGYAVLAIDHWCFGERSQNSERATVKRLLWSGKTLWAYRVHDSLAALEWLRLQAGFASLPVCTLGLSMGSTMAIWVAALDPGVRACVDLCCLAEYDALLADGSFDLHGEYFFVPGLLCEFSAAEINALIAPRAHLSLAGRDDPLTPRAGLARIDTSLRTTYASLGQGQQWQQWIDDCGHQETPAMRAKVTRFLAEVMPPRSPAPQPG